MRVNNETKIHKYMTASGVAMLFSGYIIIVVIFAIAYISPDKGVIVFINKFGEADFEIVLLLATLPSVLFVMYEYFKDTKKYKKLRKKVDRKPFKHREL